MGKNIPEAKLGVEGTKRILADYTQQVIWDIADISLQSPRGTILVNR